MAPYRSHRSHEFLTRALAVTPGGAQTRSKRHERFPPNFPTGLVFGDRQRVLDVEGNWYVDWICGLGAISLGYGHPKVQEAVEDQLLAGGASWSLPHALEIATAESLLEVLRWPEQVRWVKTGSEATVGAMMIARRATGRKDILSIGYHGWHEEHLNTLSSPWGVAIDCAIPLAAVLLEACRDEEPPSGYLQGVQDYCKRTGALLILDECVTGFRWAIGGAGEYFGITPDLAVFGKGMANGFPLACIVGRRDLMTHASEVSGTFGGEAVSLAACKATLEMYREHAVIRHMWDVGRILIQSGEFEGYPCHPRVKGPNVMEKVARAADRGHLIHPSGFNISYAHTVFDAQALVEAVK